PQAAPARLPRGIPARRPRRWRCRLAHGILGVLRREKILRFNTLARTALTDLEEESPMNEATRVLSAIEGGDPHAADALVPVVYQELRRLAAQRLAQEKPGQTLEATALVHEAYLRLVGVEKAQHWDSRGHFYSAAAEAMRRILIEQARRKQRVCHGG